MFKETYEEIAAYLAQNYITTQFMLILLMEFFRTVTEKLQQKHYISTVIHKIHFLVLGNLFTCVFKSAKLLRITQD